MKENDWTNSICKILKTKKLGKNIYVDILKNILYSTEIEYLDNSFKPIVFNTSSFKTDMLIYEKRNEKIIPRVVIESKINQITTHDAITYSQKASYHKSVIPFLRYGIMCGYKKETTLPASVLTHGKNFDFIFLFKTLQPQQKEIDAFVSMIKKEIQYSKQYEEILRDSRKKDRKKYFMLQKEFILR